MSCSSIWSLLSTFPSPLNPLKKTHCFIPRADRNICWHIWVLFPSKRYRPWFFAFCLLPIHTAHLHRWLAKKFLFSQSNFPQKYLKNLLPLRCIYCFEVNLRLLGGRSLAWQPHFLQHFLILHPEIRLSVSSFSGYSLSRSLDSPSSSAFLDESHHKGTPSTCLFPLWFEEKNIL